MSRLVNISAALLIHVCGTLGISLNDGPELLWQITGIDLAPGLLWLHLGLCSARPGLYSFELMRDDLARFVDNLGLVCPVLIGHSMGGTVAYLNAEAFSDSVRKLVIVDTPPPFPLASPWPEPDPVPDDVPFEGRVLAPIIRQLNAPDPAWWTELAKLQIPLMLIGGGSTSKIPQDKLAEVIGRIPTGRLVTSQGADHSVHRTRPAEFIALVREFLTEHSERA